MMTDLSNTQESMKYRSGLLLSKDQYASIEKNLRILIDMIPAKFILLVDTSGQLVTIMGEYSTVETAILGSLMAADLAASHEIARITGSFQEFQMVLREGEKNHIAICEAGKELLFLVLFSKEVPLGWARKLILRYARQIGEIAEKQPVVIMKDENQGLKSVKGDLPDLFNDALNEIWKD